jgi:hypothetical protein
MIHYALLKTSEHQDYRYASESKQRPLRSLSSFCGSSVHTKGRLFRLPHGVGLEERELIADTIIDF